MRKIISFIVNILLLNVILSAQKTSEEMNELLDTKTYFGFRVNYMSNITLSDSVKHKFLIALSGNLTPRLKERYLTLTPDLQKYYLKKAKRQCSKDSACTEQTYQQIIADIIDSKNNYYTTQNISGQLVLAAGSCNIKEAIPLLESALENKRYGQSVVLMALAKLGNDSIKDIFMEKYTLSYVLKNTQYDTINDSNILYNLAIKAWGVREGIETAMYLENKEMLLNILDLIYIRGISARCFSGGSRCYDYPSISFFVTEYLDYNSFHKLPDFQIIQDVCINYRNNIQHLYRDRQNVESQKELEILLSTEYRTKVRNEIRDWIIENVNFE